MQETRSFLRNWRIYGKIIVFPCITLTSIVSKVKTLLRMYDTHFKLPKPGQNFKDLFDNTNQHGSWLSKE